MIFVLPIFVLGGFVLLALWWLFFRAAVRHESAVRAAKEREAGFDRLLRTPNEPLYCLDCREIFPGPLDEDGCPKCHVRAFVIPARSHTDASVAAAAAATPAEPAPAQVILHGPPTPDDTLQSRQSQRNL